MLLIFTNKITNRTRFIFRTLLSDILHLEIEFTNNTEEYISYNGPKLCYAKAQMEEGIFFAAHNLLFERGIKHDELSFIEFNEMPAFFPVYQEQSAMPFDPFAASFYLVSRYEEYMPYKKDQYGRFAAGESIAFQKGFLHKAVVNHWAIEIGKILQTEYPQLEIKKRKYRFIPTIDIDAAWAYKEKGWFRTLGGYANALANFDFEDMKERTKVLAGLQTDPFDTYDFQFQIHKKYKLNPIYFILFGEYGLNDKNISVRNRKFHTLVKSLADHARVGIHPSFNSNQDSKKLKQEVERLNKVLNREIVRSRQHFLVLELPATYRNLINLDITDDYTMGFAANPGFRAGICTPYHFYDLDLDVETNLTIHPFTYMEGTLKDYMNLSVEEALKTIYSLVDEVKGVGGTFISIWHNESLSDNRRWKGWKQVYEQMIEYALPDKR